MSIKYMLSECHQLFMINSSQLKPYDKSDMFLHVLPPKDGPQAGQTVPHVHIHIIPRKKGDFENNDEIYDAVSFHMSAGIIFLCDMQLIYTTLLTDRCQGKGAKR